MFKNLLKKDRLMILGCVAFLAFLSVFSFIDISTAANQPLTITRGGTGIDSLCEGCFFVGESIDRASSTNAISINMTTGAVNIGEIAIAGATEGDMAVGNNLAVGTTSPQSRLHVFGSDNGSGTTTTDFGDHTSSTNRTCFNVNQADGSDASFYFMGAAIVVQTGACTD